MGTRWRTYHVVLLTFAVFCNSQHVRQTQPFAPSFSQSPQNTRTLRQQNVPFNGRGSNFRTAQDQFSRAAIRRPASKLQSQPTFSLANSQAPFDFRNQNNQPFSQVVRQPASNPQAQGVFNQQPFQNNQNPTPPSITQSLPKQTFQRIQIQPDAKIQQAQQELTQSRFQTSQQPQGFTQQKQPNFSPQFSDEKFRSQQPQTISSSLQVLDSRQRFLGVQPKPFSSFTDQQQSQITKSQNRFQESQSQAQQTFPTLPPPPQLPQVPQPQTRFQKTQSQTEQKFSTLLKMPQSQNSFQQLSQPQQKFPTLPPPPQLAQVSQPQTRFQETQRQTEQRFETLSRPPQLPQSQNRFQESQRQTFPALSTSPQLPQVAHPQTRFQETQRQTEQRTASFPRLPQLSQSQNRFQDSQLQSQQTFPSSTPPSQLLQSQTRFLEAQRQTHLAFSTPQLPQAPQTQTRFQEEQHQTGHRFSTLPLPPQLTQTQTSFQEAQRQTEQTFSTPPPPPPPPQLPHALQSETSFQETRDKTEKTFPTVPSRPQFPQQFQDVQRQTPQVFLTPQSTHFRTPQITHQDKQTPQFLQQEFQAPRQPQMQQFSTTRNIFQRTQQGSSIAQSPPQIVQAPQSLESQHFSSVQNEFEEQSRTPQPLPTLPTPPKLPNPPKVQLRVQSDEDAGSEDRFSAQFQNSQLQAFQPHFSKAQSESQERRRPQQALPALPAPPKLPNPQNDLEAILGLPDDSLVSRFQNPPPQPFQSQQPQNSPRVQGEFQKRRRPQQALSTSKPRPQSELGTIVVPPQDAFVPQFQSPTFQFRRPQNEFKEPQQDKISTDQETQQNFQSQEQTFSKPQIHKRLKSVKKPVRLIHRGNKHRVNQSPQPEQTQPSQELQRPKHIIRVLDPQQRSEQFQQTARPFDSRKLALQQPEQFSRSQTFPVTSGQDFTTAEDEAAQIKQRFQLQRQQQSENLPRHRGKPARDESLEEEDDSDQAGNAMYSFSSSVKDTIHDNQVTREETRDGKKVSGSYSYSDGFVMRTVHYEADEKGYRVVKEETAPIGQGPVEDIDGTAEVTSNVGGNNVAYSITADDVPLLAKLRDEP